MLFLILLEPVLAPNPGGENPDIPLGQGYASKAAFRVAVALAYFGLKHLLEGAGDHQGRLIQRGHGVLASILDDLEP